MASRKDTLAKAAREHPDGACLANHDEVLRGGHAQPLHQGSGDTQASRAFFLVKKWSLSEIGAGWSTYILNVIRHRGPFFCSWVCLKLLDRGRFREFSPSLLGACGWRTQLQEGGLKRKSSYHHPREDSFPVSKGKLEGSWIALHQILRDP